MLPPICVGVSVSGKCEKLNQGRIEKALPYVHIASFVVSLQVILTHLRWCIEGGAMLFPHHRPILERGKQGAPLRRRSAHPQRGGTKDAGRWFEN